MHVSLSPELWKIHKAVEDRGNPMLKVAESLSKFAAMGGFTIRYESSTSPRLVTPPTTPTPPTGSTRSPSAGVEQPPSIEQAAIPGPPGGWARYRQYRKSFDLRRRIDMLNGLYGCIHTYTRVLREPDYLDAAARETVDVPSNTMGFVTKSKQLYLNVDHDVDAIGTRLRVHSRSDCKLFSELRPAVFVEGW
jgi:hypothetical protein